MQKIDRHINISDSQWMPGILAFMLVVRISISFVYAPWLLPLSYLILGIMGVCTTWFLIYRCSKGRISKWEAIVAAFFVSIMISTIYHSADIKHCGIAGMELAFLMLLPIIFNQHKYLLYGAAIGFAVCICANLVMILLDPLSLVETVDFSAAFLLGGNYNQFGARLLCGIMTCMLCIPHNRKWLIVTLLVAIISIVTLVLVSSMTSLTCVVALCILCLISNPRCLRYALWSIVGVYLLFQLGVCFGQGEVMGGQIVRWFVEDVLGKDMTFTYRTYLWEIAGERFAESPIIGYGMVDSDKALSLMNNIAIGPHNGMYALLLMGGIVTFALFWVMVGYVIKECRGKMNSLGIRTSIAFAVLLLMQCFEFYPFIFSIYLLTILLYLPYSTHHANS